MSDIADRMRNIIALICAIALLNACASTPDDDMIAAADDVATCSESADCAAKWARAQQWVAQISYWKIQTANDAFIQTFGPDTVVNSTALAFSIFKTPLAGGGFAIEARAECANLFGCEVDPWLVLAAFNDYVKTGVSRCQRGFGGVLRCEAPPDSP